MSHFFFFSFSLKFKLKRCCCYCLLARISSLIIIIYINIWNDQAYTSYL